MTALSPEQFGIVRRELELMIADDELDEAWRILRMFRDGRFNYQPRDFPKSIREAVSGNQRQRSYADLLAVIKSLPSAVFDVLSIGVVGSHDIVRIATRPATAPFAQRLPICLVAGLHGDEADGIWGAVEFAWRFARNTDLLSTYALKIYPCCNPVGYERMTRENGNGKDLNREFFRDSTEQEVRIIERELRGHEFIGFIGGHSDYESFGLYAYATGAVLSERLAKPALFQASSVIPINTDPIIDGHPAQYGIINEKFPGSLGPLSRGDTEPFDVTIETPNLFSLRKRVEAQAIAFETILQEYRAVASEAMYL